MEAASLINTYSMRFSHRQVIIINFERLYIDNGVLVIFEMLVTIHLMPMVVYVFFTRTDMDL